VTEQTYVLVLTTMPTEDQALQLAEMLVQDQLAACVNVLPKMSSIYRWDDQLRQGTEHQVIIKTTTGRLSALHDRLQASHPYEIPELLEIPIVGGGKAYLNWVSNSVDRSQNPDREKPAN